MSSDSFSGLIDKNKFEMSTETLTKLNPKILINSKFDPKGSDVSFSDPKISNTELKTVHIQTNKKKNVCINKLQDRLKKEENTKKFENRILSGLVLSIVAVLFFVAT